MSESYADNHQNSTLFDEQSAVGVMPLVQLLPKLTLDCDQRGLRLQARELASGKAFHLFINDVDSGRRLVDWWFPTHRVAIGLRYHDRKFSSNPAELLAWALAERGGVA